MQHYGTFAFVTSVTLLLHGTLHEKKEILAIIGSNLVLKDKILSLTVPKTFITIQEAKIEADRIIAMFKPEKKADSAVQMMYLYQENFTLWMFHGSKHQDNSRG